MNLTEFMKDTTEVDPSKDRAVLRNANKANSPIFSVMSEDRSIDVLVFVVGNILAATIIHRSMGQIRINEPKAVSYEELEGLVWSVVTLIEEDKYDHFAAQYIPLEEQGEWNNGQEPKKEDFPEAFWFLRRFSRLEK